MFAVCKPKIHVLKQKDDRLFTFRKGCLNDTRNAMHVETKVVRYTCPKGTVWMEGNYSYRTNGTYNEGRHF